ncbi:hypothetical protein MUK42_07678 [Musa troglodytarum]|uniref:Protein NEOXANTHIN-DEFICIENT 1 n=1 Tax=Musa troglodytarum TaxID=320322 RepID=A0A9E7HT72_9LILI|nr:hypothetical protein MUK42_07678 [Musa troglodytarum]
MVVKTTGSAVATGLNFELPGVGLGIDGTVRNDFRLLFSFRLCARAALVVQRKLHLVKADIARALIPKELKLVEAFGYTLGGLFLAHYDDSPAGEFDELVVIPGIVWNPPTSWASRVLVNSHEACRHGRKVTIGWVLRLGYHFQALVAGLYTILVFLSIPVKLTAGICQLRNLIFSRVRAVEAVKISRPRTIELNKFPDVTEVKKINFDGRLTTKNEERECSIAVLLSKPILALEFSLLKMQVEAPTDVTTQSRSKKNQVLNTTAIFNSCVTILFNIHCMVWDIGICILKELIV